MPQLIVTAHRLNKRKVIPTVLPDPNNKAGEVFLNHTFEAEEVAEVPNPSLGKWYKDRDGYFYWSGGLNEAPDVVTGVDTAPVYDINYKKTLDFLPAEWLGKDSPDSHIIIIDTGVSLDKLHFNDQLFSEINLVAEISKDRDHGTFIAGIVGGNGNCVTGITSGVKVTSIRYRDPNTLLPQMFDNLNEALENVNEFFVKEPIKRLLVNISQGFGKTQVDKFPEKVKLIRMKIEELAAAGVLFFCAAGDDNSLADQDLEFPANLPSVISVGCISAENLGMNISKSITFASKFQECRSFDSSFNVIPDTGSSFSAPVMASIAAQIKPAGTISKTDFINAVSAFDMATNAFDFRTDKYQFSLIK